MQTAIRSFLVRLVAGLFVACLIGCDRGEPGGADAAGGGSEKYRIAVIPKGTSHEFWKSVEAGASKADAELTDVRVTFKGPQTEGETSGQIKVTENFIVDGYDAICLAPLDANALRGPVDRALKAKIPIVIFDSALRDPTGTSSYVATNNHQGGVLAGEYLAELMGGKGKAILLRYMLNSESTEQRESGFMEAIGKYPDIEFLSQDMYAGADEDAAISKAENLLLNFGEQVDGIFCPNESSTSAMLTVLRRNLPPERLGKVKFVGFDSSDNLISGLRDGHLHGVVLQDPVQMGYQAVISAWELLNGKAIPARIETTVHLAKYDDLEDELTDLLLFPAKAR